MAKKIIVKLWKDGVGRSLVATSQVITLDGLGSGPVIAADFADNSLQGTVNTSAQRGGFYKELKSPVWSLNALKTQVTAGNNIVLNWATRPADITPTINWYAVNTNQQIIYTGSGLVSNKSITPLLISGEGGTFNVATSPVDVNREVEITIWNGEFGISNLLARSGPIRIIAKELQASFPQAAYPFRTAIPLNISGYPHEFVTYEGFGSAYTKGIRGNITLDSAGRFYVPDIRGGLDAPPGPYSYTFDGNITARSVTATVVITTEGFYALQFTTPVPEIITIGDSLVLGISGAPNELVTYSGPTVGTFSLNAGGAASTPNLVAGQTLIPNKQYSWRFSGNISINPLSAVVGTIAGKELNATGPSPIAQATAYSVTVTGKANDNITYTDVKANIPVLYFDYYPEAEAIWTQAGSPTNTESWITTYHTSTGSGLGFLSPTQLATEAAKSYTGSFTLGDIGGDNGSNTFQVVASSGLLGRRTPYKFRFYSAQLNQTKEVSVTVNRIFTLKVVGPASVEAGKPIAITVYSVAGDNTVKITGPNLPVGGYTLDAFNSAGQYSFNLQPPILTSQLSAGSYTFNFDSTRPDVINVGNAATTPYSLTVTASNDIIVIPNPPIIVDPVTGLSLLGENEITPNTTYTLTIRSSVGDEIKIQKDLPASWTNTNAYFDIYPDVVARYNSQTAISDRGLYATQHYENIGKFENRISPAGATEYRNNLEPLATLTFGPLVKPSTPANATYGEVLANVGSYRYPLSSPIVLKISGKAQELSKSFRVKLAAELRVNLPTTSTIDDVFVSISGLANDEITCIKIESERADNIPVPVVPRQQRTFFLGNDGTYGGDFLSGTENASGDLNELEPNAPNVYYFYSKKTGATTQAAVRGASLVVQTGTAMLYPNAGGSKGTYDAPELMIELPARPVYVMYAIVGGGGGGAGDDTNFLKPGGARIGGRGGAGNSARGILRLNGNTPKKLYGVAGAGGKSGYWGTGAAGGVGGDGATFNKTGRIINGRGGTGGNAGVAGVSGSAGGGGGSSLLAFEVSGQRRGLVATGGGGGGGGASNSGGGYDAGNTPSTSGAPSIIDWGVVTTPPPLANRDPSTDGSGNYGGNNSGDGGGGGGGGGGLGVGGSAGNPGDGPGNGGLAGYTFYNAVPESVTYTDYEWNRSTDVFNLTNKILNREYYGAGGANKGAGAPGAIKIFWTTSTTKPTDYGLLPDWPVTGSTSGVAELTWTVPTATFVSNQQQFYAIFQGGRVIAKSQGSNGVTMHVNDAIMAKFAGTNEEAPFAAFQDYIIRFTVVSKSAVTEFYAQAGGLGVNQSRTWKFKDMGQYIWLEKARGNAQTKIEIIKPDGVTVVATGFQSWPGST